MNATTEPRLELHDPGFWDHLARLEAWRRRVQSDHESARRQLDRVDPKATTELHQAWLRYCDVIEELDRSTGEFELLRRVAC